MADLSAGPRAETSDQVLPAAAGGPPQQGGELTSPLHERHRGLGAKMADFGGWLMPIEYAGGPAAPGPGGGMREHAAVRERVGLFDVSHLGKAWVTGTGAAAYVNRCFTNDLAKIGPGRAQYTLCCAPDGGVIDDLIVYLISDDEVFLIPNAANTATVVAQLARQAPPGIEARDAHREHAVLAVQGPDAAVVLEAVGLPGDHDYMSFVQAELTAAGAAAVPVTVCRTGYTGEWGYEVVAPWAQAEPVWDVLLAAVVDRGGLPCGLGARDTLRTEMGYPLHGHELSTTISPVQAKLGWAVGWKKPEFWGREALTAEKAAGASRSAWGLLVQGKGIPRPGCRVLTADDGTTAEPAACLGEVTSGTFSPTLRQGIALALIDTAAGCSAGDRVIVDVRGRGVPATLVKPPFVETEVRG